MTPFGRSFTTWWVIAGQMDLGGETFPGPAQTVVVGLLADPARRLLPGPSVPTGTRSMLMCPAHRGVDVHFPCDQPNCVRSGLRPGRQQRLQHHPLLVRKVPSPHIQIIAMRDEGEAHFQKHGLGDGTTFLAMRTSAAGDDWPPDRQRWST